MVLKEKNFNDLCAVLGLKDQVCSDPDRKAIERGFRKKALITHPDKGGDPVEFKIINEAYEKLIGHITKVRVVSC